MTERVVSFHGEVWATETPFRITGSSRSTFEVVVVEISEGEVTGRGEGLPIHYLGESIPQLLSQLDGADTFLRGGGGRDGLHAVLPAGGARSAVDAALWDLEAKQKGTTAWRLAEVTPRPLTTALTIGIEDTPEAMARKAAKADGFPLLKIKLDATQPIERVAAIRDVRPDARLVVDANQAWTFNQLRELMPALQNLGVEMVEQPLPRGGDAELEGYVSPLPLCADESCQDRGELDLAAARYDVINIKLDKCGGLTEGLRFANEVRSRGLKIWTGNMGGTSLGMAPAYVVGLLADFVELDGPHMLKHDRMGGFDRSSGILQPASARLWG